MKKFSLNNNTKISDFDIYKKKLKKIFANYQILLPPSIIKLCPFKNLDASEHKN